MVRYGLVLLVGTLLWQVPASAEGTGDKARAKELHLAAVEAYKSGRYDDAIKLFQGAIASDASLCAAYTSLGAAFMKVGKKKETYHAYKKFIERCPRHQQAYTVSKTIKEAEEKQPAIAEFLPESQIFGPPSQEELDKLCKPSSRPSHSETNSNSQSASLDVSVVGSSAFVFVDGVKIKTTPLIDHSLSPGTYIVELRDSSDEVIRRWNVRIRPGQKIKLIHQPEQTDAP